MTDALPPERFYDLVASYGADPDRWPADRRAGAVAALVEFEAARTAWRQAAQLDAALDSVVGADLSPQLAERIMAIATPATAVRVPSKGRIGLRHAVSYAAAAVLALFVGLAAPSPWRDASGTIPVLETAVTEPATSDESSAGLAALALVDVPSSADATSDTGGSDSASDTSPLSGLPLL